MQCFFLIFTPCLAVTAIFETTMYPSLVFRGVVCGNHLMKQIKVRIHLRNDNYSSFTLEPETK